jgi:hypothetical protein
MPVEPEVLPGSTPQSVSRILVNQSVTIDSVIYKAGYAGSNMSLVFSVYLSNVLNVSDVQLIREGSGQIYKITNVGNGLNKLYDNTIRTFPTYPQNVFYYFIITLTTGEVLTSTKFQVS